MFTGCAAVSGSRRPSSIRAASSPLRRTGWWTVVSGGSVKRVRGRSSKPTMLRSSGTERPRWRAAWSTPAAAASLIDSTAVGRKPVFPGAQEGGLATVEGRRRETHVVRPQLDVVLLERELVAAHPPGHDAARRRLVSRKAPSSGRAGRGGPARAGAAPRPARRTCRRPRSRRAPAMPARRRARSAARRDGSTRPPGGARSRPITITPSTVARAIARSIEPCSGEMNSRPKPRSSVTVATPSAKSAKKGLAKTCGEGLRREDADRSRSSAAVSMRATGWVGSPAPSRPA